MLWMLPIAGAGLGAMLNKKDPLKGAALGGLLGAGGAYAAPSMSAGLLNFSGGQAAAPIVDLSTKASAQTAASIPAQGAGMFDTLAKYAAPASNVANVAEKAGAFGGNQPQYPQAQFQQGSGFAGLLTPTEQVDPEKRRQAQQMAVQGLLGGYGGYRG